MVLLTFRMCSGLRSHLRTRWFSTIAFRDVVQLFATDTTVGSVTVSNPIHYILQSKTSPTVTGESGLPDFSTAHRPTLSPGSTKTGLYLTNSARRATRYSIGLFPLIQTPSGLPPIHVRSRGGLTRSAATPTIAGCPRAASRRRVTLGPRAGLLRGSRRPSASP